MAVAERDETQAKMAKLSMATLAHTPSQNYTVADRFEERAAEQGDRPFLVFAKRMYSYAEVNRRANRIAHAAHELGLRTGDVAALMMENRPEFIITWLGLAKLGVTTALVNSQVSGKPLSHALEVVEGNTLFVGSECLNRLDDIATSFWTGWQVLICPDPGVDGVRADDETPPTGRPDSWMSMDDIVPENRVNGECENPPSAWREKLKAGEDLFHIFTSGTTGLPKAARLSHMRFLGVGDGMSAIAEYGPDDVLYCVLPLYHGAGGMVVVSCALTHGARIVLRRKFSVSAFWNDVRENGVTATQYIGEICRYLLNRPATAEDRDHKLRTMMGAGLGPDIWAEFQDRFGIERILEGWSSTEANTSLINLDNRLGSCGRVPYRDLHNARLIQFDVETEAHPKNDAGFCIECEVGDVGEMIGMIPDLPDSGAGRFEGYTDADATEQKILRNVFAEGDAWYRSGDLLRRDEDDYYYFVDRIGDTFRWKSENVSTQEVSEALGGFSGLEIANVYGVAVPGMPGRAGMAALVMAPNTDFDPKSFYEFAAERLPKYAMPVFVRLMNKPDMTTTFKLRKVDLQRAGYGAGVGDDLLFVCDEAAGTYVEATESELQRLDIPCFDVST